MSKWILLIALAALALGSAFFLTRGGHSADFETLGNGAQQTEVVPQLDNPIATLRGLDRGSNPAGADNGSAQDRVSRTQIGHVTQAATAGGEFHVLLIDPKRKTPLEGMRVFLLNRESLGPDEWRLAGTNVRELRKLIKEKGIESSSDAEGGAYFERVLDGAVWAEGSGWQGFHDWIGPPESPLILSLSPLSELEILVLDEEGSVVRNAPMAVQSMKADQWIALMKRNTISSGIAQFPGVSDLVNRASKTVPLSVGFYFPHAPRVWQEIDPEWLPEEPLEMQIPPHAPLTIRVVDEEGALFESFFTVEVGMATETQGERVTSILVSRGSSGEVTFPFVGANAPLRVQLTGISELKNLIVDVRGPSKGEKDAVREIAWFQKRLRVIGSVRGPSGLLIERRLQASWGDGNDQSSLPIKTDEKGNFSILMSGATGANLHFRAMSQGNEGPSVGSVALPSPIPNGDWDAGLVILEGEPLFAEGRVVTSGGRPLVGAKVRLEGWRSGEVQRTDRGGGGKSRGSSQNRGGSKSGDGKGAANAKGKGGEGQWSQVGRLYTLTDDEGHFRIYGRAYSNQLRLTASHREHLPHSIEGVESGMAPWYFNLEPGIPPKQADPIGNESKER